MAFDNARHCTFSARLDCHYLLHAPATIGPQTALVVTLHGFGENPEVMMGLTGKLFGQAHVIASLEGPNRFFRSRNTEDIGCGWGTPRHAAGSIRLHHEMVRHVLYEAGREFAIPTARRIIAGFSQPVGLNYRFAATHPECIGGVVAICGGMPSDWESETAYRKVAAPLLHIACREDEFYPLSVTDAYPARLRVRAADVEYHVLGGAHRVPSEARPLIANWLERILR